MISISLPEDNEDFMTLIRRASEDRVLITKEGRPVGMFIGFADEDDYFKYQLENDPRFEARIERARQQKRDGKVTRLEDIE